MPLKLLQMVISIKVSSRPCPLVDLVARLSITLLAPLLLSIRAAVTLVAPRFRKSK
jgi:hypothetical protein